MSDRLIDFYKKAKNYYLFQEENERWMVTTGWFYRLIKFIKQDGTYLDVGCGGGVLVNEIRKEKQIVGIGSDISLEGCKIGKKNGGHFVVSDSYKLAFKNNSIDNVSSFGLLEHIEDVETTLLEIIRVLKLRGYLFLFVPQWLPYGRMRTKYWEFLLVVLCLYFIRCIVKRTSELVTLKIPFKVENKQEWEDSENLRNINDLDACSMILGISIVDYLKRNNMFEIIAYDTWFHNHDYHKQKFLIYWKKKLFTKEFSSITLRIVYHGIHYVRFKAISSMPIFKHFGHCTSIIAVKKSSF